MTIGAREMLEYLDGGRRWFKGELRGPGQSVCLVGAGIEVGVSETTWAAIQKVILEQYPDRLDGWGRKNTHPGKYFNDHPDTMWWDVERVLEKTALAEDDLV